MNLLNLSERNANLKAFFDEKTVGYDDVHIRFMQSKAALTAALPDGITNVLDLGAGTGMELIPFFERFPDAAVTAVDLSEDMLGTLRTRPFADHIHIVAGDFFTVDLGCGYDAMISTSALHHFTPEDKERLYKRVYEALQPGGLFVNADKTCCTPADSAECFRVLREDPTRWSHIDTPLSVGEECAVLEKAGFVIRTVTTLPNEQYYLFVAEKVLSE